MQRQRRRKQPNYCLFSRVLCFIKNLDEGQRCDEGSGEMQVRQVSGLGKVAGAAHGN